MMSRIFKYLTIALTAVVATCCSYDNEKASPISESAFRSLFPECKTVEWSNEPGYEIARFQQGGAYSEAWFDHEGWIMTAKSESIENLPTPALELLETEYGLWETIRVTQLDRKGCASVTVVTVERNKVTYDLYFSDNGILVRKSDETNAKQGMKKYLPATPGKAITGTVKEMYPDAVIYNFTENDGVYTICLATDSNIKTVLLSDSGEWLLTISGIGTNDIDPVIKKAVETQLPGGKITLCNLTETPSNSFYTIECDNGGTTHTLFFDKK